ALLLPSAPAGRRQPVQKTVLLADAAPHQPAVHQPVWSGRSAISRRQPPKTTSLESVVPPDRHWAPGPKPRQRRARSGVVTCTVAARPGLWGVLTGTDLLRFATL